MRISRIFIFTCATALMLSLSSCRTTTDSQAQGDYDLSSLTVFQETEKPLICTPNETEEFQARFTSYLRRPDEAPDWGQIDVREKYRPFVREAVSAVPHELADLYFRMGGILRLIRNANEYCTSQNVSFNVPIIGQDGEINGCLLTQDNAPDQPPRMLIGVRDELLEMETYEGEAADNLRQDLTNISQGFALLFSFIVSEMGQPDVSGQVARAQLGQADATMTQAKVMLAFMFTEDYINAKRADASVYMPSTYQELLSGTRAFDADSFESRDAHWAYFWGLKDQDNAWVYINSVFAQIIDSDYCSNETRSLLYDDGAIFKRTGGWYRSNIKAEIDAGIMGGSSLGLTSQDGEGEALPIADFSESVAPSLEFSAVAAGAALRGGWRFPILRGVFNAPFAVSRYFINNRPVARFFQHHRPVRRFIANVAWAGARVVAGTARVVGGVARGTARAIFPGTRCWRTRRGTFCR